MAPVRDLLGLCAHQRAGPELSDAAWIHLGLHRVLQEVPSGRAYLQQHGYQFEQCPSLKEQEMQVLKRLAPETRRQSAPKGRKVIWVGDKAGIQSVELVAGQAGVLVRRIRDVEPVTGTE